MLETILTLSDTKNHPFYEKIDFSKITTPILHKFQPLYGVTTWLPTFALPQNGWSNTSFITPKSCIAAVYPEPYENLIQKRTQTEILRYLWPTSLKTQCIFGHSGFRGFLFHPSFKLIFRMVPNKLAQYNFRAL